MRRSTALGAALLLAVAVVVVPAAGVGAAVDEDANALWPASVVPGVPNWPDANSVELGVRFITAEDVWVTGVRFYKGDMNTGTHFGTLWTEGGALLATGEFQDETAEGWQDVLFDDPVAISPGQVYVASYWVPVGYYAAVNDYFAGQGVTVGPITALQSVGADGNGVYAYSETTEFPTFSYRHSNYWVTPLWTPNSPPSVDAGLDVSGAEGSAIPLSGSASDPDSDTLTLSWTVATPPGDGGSCVFSAPTSALTDITCDDDGTVVATLTADDGFHPPVSDTVSVEVANVAPSLVVDAGDGEPVSVQQQVPITAAVADPGANDTLTCSFDWGDGASDAVVAAGGECAASHAFGAPEVYTVTVSVTDDDGASSSYQTMVVVYDPSAGFVTGGGWVDSPAGAYVPDEALTGKAIFGFVSKYKKGATTPTGNTEFQFQTAALDFHSTSYEWLVVTGSNFAKFKGVGTVNGESDYRFMLWAGDDSPDTFRIKIWTEDAGGAETVIYDNGMDQAIRGGSIKIHSPKNGK
jgi:hypothetical protein